MFATAAAGELGGETPSRADARDEPITGLSLTDLSQRSG